jgi:lipopolysaccharide biosynthesis glycosyltransferase
MNIIFYSDKNYEYQAEALIKSIILNCKQKVNLIYYTIGFESNLNYDILIKRIFPLDIKKKKFEFYKPAILLDAIDTFGGNILFLDTDIIIGKRFNIDKLIHNNNYPLLSCGNWDYPFACKIHSDNTYSNVINEEKLIKYFGVNNRSMNYVYTCMVSLNEKCRDIILEWKSMCENEFLMQNQEEYYPFKDETPMNIILWKRGITENYGRIYLNTLHFNPLKYIEDNENIVGDPSINFGIFGSDLMRCENSSNIMFYHGIKDKEELTKTINYYNGK